MKLAEVKASYTNDKREDARKDPWAHYVARPISFYPAWFCIKLRLSANAVTTLGFLAGLVGCYLLMNGYWIWGAVLVNIYGLSDYVDGDIARATNTQSDYGARLDGFTYLAMTAFLFTCIGLGYGGNILVFGVAASFIRVFRFAVTYQANLPSEGGKANPLFRVGMAIIGMREPLLLIAAISGFLNVFVYFYCAVNFCELLVIMYKVLWK